MIIQSGVNGAVSVYVGNRTHVILDINGYFVDETTPGALSFYTLRPCRVADTRASEYGVLGPPYMTGGTQRTFPLRLSNCGIPENALAYSLNITVTPRPTLGFLTVFPTGQVRPWVSTLSATTGAQTANAAIVPAGTAGQSRYSLRTIPM